MKGLFCSSKANNNEEYKKDVKARMKIMIIIFAIGSITLITSLLAKNMQSVAVSRQMLSVYSGVGTGLIVASAVLWIKNKIILADDEKLKKSRLESTDERIREISNKAFKAAGTVLIFALYVTGLIGGLFYPVLVRLLLYLVCIFLIAYVTAYKIYEKRM